MMDKKIQSFIKQATTILIISSIPIDADSIASGIILKKYLESLGKSVTLYCPVQLDRVNFTQNFIFLSSLPYFNEVLLKDTRDIDLTIYDIAFFLDGRNLIQFYNSTLTKENPPEFHTMPIRIHIDHHDPSEEVIGTYSICKKNISSTTELILQTVVPIESLDKDCALLAYAGIVTDTGNFKWLTFPSTLELTSKLLEKEIAYQSVLHALFNSKTKEYLQAVQWCIEHMEYDATTGTIFLSISQEYHFSFEEIVSIREAFMNEIAGSMLDYPRGILIIEKNEHIVDVRAKGDNFTNQIHLPHLFKNIGGNGEGHPNFAHTDAPGSIDIVKQQLIEGITKDIF